MPASFVHSEPELAAPLSGEAAPSSMDPIVVSSLLAAASIFELIAGVMICASGSVQCIGSPAYAISVGAVSTFCSTVVLMASRAQRDGEVHPRAAVALPFVVSFLALWWAAGTFVLTFRGPFSFLGNGYFATWCALLASLKLALMHSPALSAIAVKVLKLAQDPQCAGFVYLAFTSTLVWLGAAVCPLPSWSTVWTVVVGAVSCLLCAAFIFAHDTLGAHKRNLSLLLAGWWLQGLFITFVPSSFLGSVNGFVSVWASIVFAALLVSSALTGRPAMHAAAEPADEPASLSRPSEPKRALDASFGGGPFPGFGSAFEPTGLCSGSGSAGVGTYTDPGGMGEPPPYFLDERVERGATSY